MNIESMLKPAGPPERIHGWQHTQMSIARFSGGINYNGASYSIAINKPGQPLVRDDVLHRDAKAAKGAAKAERKAAKQRAKDAQKEIE